MLKTWQAGFLDALLTFLAVILGLMLRLEIIYVGYFIQEIWPFIALAVVIRPFLLNAFGVYQRLWRYASPADYLRLTLAVLAGTFLLSLITFLILFPGFLVTFPRSLLLIEGIDADTAREVIEERNNRLFASKTDRLPQFSNYEVWQDNILVNITKTTKFYKITATGFSEDRQISRSISCNLIVVKSKPRIFNWKAKT